MNQSIVNAAAGDLQMASAMASARPFRIYIYIFSVHGIIADAKFFLLIITARFFSPFFFLQPGADGRNCYADEHYLPTLFNVITQLLSTLILSIFFSLYLFLI